MDENKKDKKEKLLLEDKNIKEENKGELQNEPKMYINCGCFQISVGIILTYIYILISIFLNLNNRIIYHKYNFRNNFTLLFFQQFFSLISFTFLNSKSATFRNQTGEISFSDFYKFKYALIFLRESISIKRFNVCHLKKVSFSHDFFPRFFLVQKTD